MNFESPIDALPSISVLKELARKHKRAVGCTHREALEKVAKQYGFQTWKAQLEQRVQLRTADTTIPRTLWREEDPSSVTYKQRAELEELIVQRKNSAVPFATVLPLSIVQSKRRNMFHRLQIGNRIWHVLRSRDILYLKLEPSGRGKNDGGAAYIGDCTRLTYLPAGSTFGRKEEGWYIVKYSDEQQIPLINLTLPELAEVAYQYGVDLEGEMGSSRLPFFESPAFATLKRVITEFRRPPPHYGDKYRMNPYLGDWFAVAKGQPVEVALKLWGYES